MIKSLTANEPTAEICIVGTGPVGMALALEFERLDRTVLVIEAGAEAPADSDASSAEIVNPSRHATMDLAVCRSLGGTSWKWGGRCVAYDDVDWVSRDFVTDAGWPLSLAELMPWYQRAADYMLCGSGEFNLPYRRQLSDGLTVDTVERWSREPCLIKVHHDRLVSSKKIALCLNSTLTGLEIDQDGRRVESITLATPNGPCSLRVRHVILAMGGVESTRFLLLVQQMYPGLLGGVDGPLGRYYMGHISGKIADIQFENAAAASDLNFKLDRNGAWYRRRFMLTAETQIKNRVLNTAFWPDNP